ncbi:uncharacterized protein LOC116340436 isoform X2 [Contarinia nasturtii]|uniref:uncharacterized protein LOC116340436 isoform X2 n=1 Tax=Contarinia nasturtii TaxID=265458 RepID=UPI0012D4B97C|nr:uncharacterized protein LOC116340436 isoform X2 [Contarinia nasturtii]
MSYNHIENCKRKCKQNSYQSSDLPISPTTVVMLCCCFRFRIPRTKQDIEADYQRRVIAKNFRERLWNIKNSEMDNMNLQKALERIRQDFVAETQRNMEIQEMKGVVLRRAQV